MKTNRAIYSAIAIASLILAPVLVSAHPLSIVNATDSPLSFTINDHCSDEIGTVNEVVVKNITEDSLNKLCQSFTQPCAITAYYGSQCAGKPVGGIKYNSEHNFVVNGYPDTHISVRATEDTLIYTSANLNK